jgi:hypothetical protein
MWHWHLDSVSLCPLFPASPDDRWFWQVVYRADSQGGYAGPVDELRLVVLMNGTVVKPVAPAEETGSGNGSAVFVVEACTRDPGLNPGGQSSGDTTKNNLDCDNLVEEKGEHEVRARR